MSLALSVVALLAALGAGLIAGVFFAFSARRSRPGGSWVGLTRVV